MEKTQQYVLFWFRRDLRLADNIGLFHALRSGFKVIPIFIYDENILSELPKDDARVTFIGDCLSSINTELNAIGASLATFHGDPISIIKKLCSELKIAAVYCNSDYEPYALKRDEAIAKNLSDNGIEFHSHKDHVIFEKDEVTKDDSSSYVVFTPYSRKWKQQFDNRFANAVESEMLLKNVAAHSLPFFTPESIGFTRSEIEVQKPLLNSLADYESVRNFPAMDKTSKLSVHLRFGTISIREVVKIAAKSEIFLNELIWREFFIQILYHFPFTVSRSFRPKYDAIKWRNNEMEFLAWRNGMTGYPIVDAGMRELNATGFMQNRVRMITAGFLCKHLLIDWRWGEAYFALKLIDYEQASNVGNWQWAAGTGVDAAPYFRIFNPHEQTKKFDKELIYIRKWVPEFDSLTYPTPIVDHKEARDRCLRVYKTALGEF